MTDRLRVAVVGAGHLGRHHARNLARLPDVHLVAVCDTDPGRGKAVADPYGARWVAAVEELPTDLVAVSIAAPTPLHHRLAGFFVDRGVHCMVEKPMCATLAEARDLSARAEQAGVLLQVGHIERFNPVLDRLALDGPVLHVDARRLAPYPNRSVDTSVVFDLMVHDIDLVLGWIGSSVAGIEATGGCLRGPRVDWAACRLRFDSGATAHLSASRVASEPLRRATLYTARKTHEVDFQSRSLGTVGESLQAVVEKGSEEEPLFRELADFVRCVRTGQRPRVSQREGVAAVGVAEQVEALLMAR